MNVNTLYFLSFNLLLELNAVFAIIHISVLTVDVEHWKKCQLVGNYPTYTECYSWLYLWTMTHTVKLCPKTIIKDIYKDSPITLSTFNLSISWKHYKFSNTQKKISVKFASCHEILCSH